jgi:prepilin-type N-terminal cleavage/methylation domain-containing protein
MHFSRRGLTLIEVLVTLGLISVLIVAVTLIALTLFRSWPVELSHTDQRLATSNALERMLKELRSALDISAVDDKQITVWHDENDNGLRDWPAEGLTFSWSGVVGENLYRTQGTETSQVLLANTTQFVITCFDQNNMALSYPITDLTLIRSLGIELSSVIDDETVKQRFRVKVRNL